MIAKQRIPHALLQKLAAQALEPEALREHGRQFGKPHSVNVAIERLREQGLIEVKAVITPRGLFYLRKVSA